MLFYARLRGLAMVELLRGLLGCDQQQADVRGDEHNIRVEKSTAVGKKNINQMGMLLSIGTSSGGLNSSSVANLNNSHRCASTCR